MPQDLYVGSDFGIAFAVGGKSYTAFFTTFRVSMPPREVTFTPLDTGKILRRNLPPDCSIQMGGYESDKSTAGAFAALAQARLNNAPVTIIQWDTKGATPVSRLPADFFNVEVGYPLAGWRLSSVDGGPGGQTEATAWSATITPNHV